MEKKIKKIKKDILNKPLLNLIKEKSYFDLEFRRDVRYERLNHPTYYRWKSQFIIVSDKSDEKLIVEIRNILNCGKIYPAKNQIRYIVQGIDNLYGIIVPFLKDKNLLGEKEKEFNLWAEAIEIIYKNKRKNLMSWKKNDFEELLKRYKLIRSKKNKNFHKQKWISMAESIIKNLQS